MADIVVAQGSMWYIVSMPLVFLIFFFAGIAETGRSPFDLIEAESELIAGFHTEYSGLKFGLFMIGEYVHMFALSFFSAVLFLGGWQIPFVNVAAIPNPWGPIIGFIALWIKVFLFVFILMWFRGTLPRFRIDQLLDFGWKFLVPLSLVLLIAVAVVVRFFAPGSDIGGVQIEAGPLSGLGMAGEIVALLVVNLLVAGLAIVVISAAARRGRSKGLRAVTAVETSS
jgi:NADH-quinone oxidoreductase subunit H